MHGDEEFEPVAEPGFNLLAALAPSAWFGYHHMHRRAAQTLAVLLIATVAAEAVVTIAVRLGGLRDLSRWYLGQGQPNTVWLVLIAWGVWCGLGARRWQASEVERPVASPISAVAWALIAAVAWIGTLVALTLGYVALGLLEAA
ncbi:MAG: hypothetical protein ABMA64_01780 [Myxococcota bacterium]